MRVKISYEVDLEEIPEEVSKLCEDMKVRLNTAINRIEWLMNDLRSDKDTSKMLHGIHEIRKDLFRTDSRLEDTSSILKGYQRIKAAPPKVETDAEVEDE